MKFTTLAALASINSALAAPTSCLEARDVAQANAAVNTDSLVDGLPLVGPVLAGVLNSLNLGNLPAVGGVADSLTTGIIKKRGENDEQ